MCSRCMCSWRTWAGSRAVGCVVWAKSSDSVMDTWKYSVPFSSHCCFQCTWEMSSPVPDISAEHKERGKKRNSLWDQHVIPEKNASKLCMKCTLSHTLLCAYFKRKKNNKKTEDVAQRSHLTVGLCICIQAQCSFKKKKKKQHRAAARGLELLNSWTHILGCHNVMHLCTRLRITAKLLQMLSCSDESLMLTSFFHP